MAKNIEIKAKIEDMSTIYIKAKQVSDSGPTEINQDDTFYNCSNGRLKLRVFSEMHGELIFYQRPNQNGPKESFYQITTTSSPQMLGETLRLAYGVVGRVKKRRILFLVGRTRIHLDQVDDLGDFLELEVVLEDNENAEYGALEANKLMEILGIDNADLIKNAYVDLMNMKSCELSSN